MGRGTGSEHWETPQVLEGDTISSILGIHKSSSSNSEDSITGLMVDRETPKDTGKERARAESPETEFRRRHDNMMDMMS